MDNGRQEAVVTDMAQPEAPAVGAVTGTPHTTQRTEAFEVEIKLSLDRQDMIELAELFEKTGNEDALARARQIRNFLGSIGVEVKPRGKVQRVLNTNLKVKYVLLAAAAIAAGLTINELIGRYRKRNGKRWPTMGTYQPKMSNISPLRTRAKA